jgi:hypothetical protein
MTSLLLQIAVSGALLLATVRGAIEAATPEYVTCKTTASEDQFVIELKPEWSPLGVRVFQTRFAFFLIDNFFFFFFFFRSPALSSSSRTSTLTTRRSFASSRCDRAIDRFASHSPAFLSIRICISSGLFGAVWHRWSATQDQTVERQRFAPHCCVCLRLIRLRIVVRGAGTINDDPRSGAPPAPFLRGYVSFAGSGANSRTTELFISYRFVVVEFLFFFVI